MKMMRYIESGMKITLRYICLIKGSSMPRLLTTQYFDHANFQQRNQLNVFSGYKCLQIVYTIKPSISEIIHHFLKIYEYAYVLFLHYK